MWTLLKHSRSRYLVVLHVRCSASKTLESCVAPRWWRRPTLAQQAQARPLLSSERSLACVQGEGNFKTSVRIRFSNRLYSSFTTSELRYDIKMYPTFIHLHGKTFDYKIPASTVMRLFLLPHKVIFKIATCCAHCGWVCPQDQRQMFFCVNLDPPIKQGQTRYHYLIFTFMQVRVKSPYNSF